MFREWGTEFQEIMGAKCFVWSEKMRRNKKFFEKTDKTPWLAWKLLVY
jgi:hypothetical protein